MQKGEAPPLTKLKWWRLLMDESHDIKNAATQKCKAVTAIDVRCCIPASL